ncbi:MAG: NADP-dependent malic enzyme [Suipraeoptans sp.]
MDFAKAALKQHKAYGGKFSVSCKMPLANAEDLAIAYTPGVAAPCLAIKEDRQKAYTYTAKKNMIAVVTDGSAVLGLGDIGPEAGMPVMEGKAVLFKAFADVDAVPICIDTKDPEEIIRLVKNIAPTFGGINLEDIAAPKCFDIEARLEEELNIPVFHDDQHGTAIVVAAGLINALKLTGKRMSDIKVVLNGPGAAGTAILKMLHKLGVKDLIACDSKGILYSGRQEGMNRYKEELSEITNPDNKKGTLEDAVKGADVFVGVSIAGALTREMIETMKKDPIVFAMANPTPEIDYHEAMECKVVVMGTGRSDFPNQINNVLAFPGIFRGALDGGARNITDEMKIAAAYAIAEIIDEKELKPEYIIPSAFDSRVSKAVAKRVREAINL